jgi:hypothetical protein
MKTIIQNIALTFILLFTFVSCTENNKERKFDQETINWSDNKAILKAAEKYYKDSTVSLNRTSLRVYDKRRTFKNEEARGGKKPSKEQQKEMRKKMEALLNKFPQFSARHLLYHKSDTANLHKVGKETAWLPVIMTQLEDTLVVDYKIIWDTNIVKLVGDRRTVGAFRVSDVLIQQVNGEKRYEWIEDDGYWEKQLVKVDDM